MATARYRTTTSGLWCSHETWDDVFNWDGRHHEAFPDVNTKVVSADETVLQNSDSESELMGDTWRLSNPIQAGSTSAGDGIVTGDKFPPVTKPWECTARVNDLRLRTYAIWEVELQDGQSIVLLSPTIREWDKGAGFWDRWLAWQVKVDDQYGKRAKKLFGKIWPSATPMIDVVSLGIQTVGKLAGLWSQRTCASVRPVQALSPASLELDPCPILPLIHPPTLVLHRRDAHLIPIKHARCLVEYIPDAKLGELPEADLSLMSETREQALDLIDEFLTGVHRVPPPRRVLATLLFTDIVGSTKLAGRLRDRRWRELLDIHHEVSRQTVEGFSGRLVETTGDGILATFDGPGRAIGCAAALRNEMRGIGLQLREGLHSGEVELRDGDVRGVAVHIAARVMDAARPGEILTSRTVRDLVVGSDVVLEERGVRRLRGVDGRWQLYAVARPGSP